MLVLLFILLFAGLSTPEANVPRLTAAEVHDSVQRGDAVVIDVRGSVPWDLGHIKGAIWLPLGRVAADGHTLPKDKLIVAYCTCQSEELSLAAAVELGKLGYERVAALRGGYAAWADAGYAVESNSVEEEPPPPPVPMPDSDGGGSRGGRMSVPEGIPCSANDVTTYPGVVTRYRHTRATTTITIRTDFATTETVILKHPRTGDPAQFFQLNREPFRAADWKTIEVRHGVIRPGMRAHAWVCRDGKALIDWRPGEPAPVD
jgi:rhodanese-related sulfurtransferase